MFLNPLMLAWVVGAALPVLVHLLNRSRYRQVEWGAMMFLPGMPAAEPHRWRFRQWGLLLVRSMTVGLLAVALARPVYSGKMAGLIPAPGLTTGGQATVVIILDDSASMGYTRNGQSRLDQARAVTLQILSGLKHGDQAALLLAGVSPDQSIATPVTDLQSIVSRVEDLTPGNGEARLADALTRAAAILDHAGGTDHEIFVVCDRQALSWRRALDPSFFDGWAARRTAGSLAGITVFPVGGYESDNVAVESLRLAAPPLIRGQPGDLQVRVRNFGSEPAVAVPVSVWAGPRPLGELTVTVPPGSSRQVELKARFPETGSFVVSAAVRTTGLTFDDRLDRAVEVADPIRVLLITGDHPGTAGSSVASILRTALAGNHGVDRNASNLADVTTAAPLELAGLVLDRFQVIVLADVSNLTPDAIPDIEEFVYGGGGVWFVPGDRIRADEFDQLLYRSGSGIFPAALGAPTPAGLPTGWSISAIDRRHPVFDFLGDSSLPAWSVRRFFPATTRTPDARVIAALSSGQPFLIETTAGRGHVLMSTVSPAENWSNLSDSPAFASLARSILRYLASAEIEERNLAPNQPIVATVPGPIDDRVPTVQLMPSGRREPATIRRFEDRTEMRYYRTDLPGNYRLRYRAGGIEKTINFVVSASREESDLTPLTDVQLQSLRGHLGVRWIEPTGPAIDNAVAHLRSERELWIDLIGVVLALSLLELVIARFGLSTT